MAEQGEDWAVAEACHRWVNTLGLVEAHCKRQWTGCLVRAGGLHLWLVGALAMEHTPKSVVSLVQCILKPTVVHQMSDGFSSSGTETETV